MWIIYYCAGGKNCNVLWFNRDTNKVFVRYFCNTDKRLDEYCPGGDPLPFYISMGRPGETMEFV